MKLKYIPKNFQECKEILKNKDSVKLGNNVYLENDYDIDSETNEKIYKYHIKHYSTYVITFYDDNNIRIQNSGFYTNTTKNLLNQFLYFWNMRLSQENFDWFMYDKRNSFFKETNGKFKYLGTYCFPNPIV